jgi:hypothetical protein
VISVSNPLRLFTISAALLLVCAGLANAQEETPGASANNDRLVNLDVSLVPPRGTLACAEKRVSSATESA